MKLLKLKSALAISALCVSGMANAQNELPDNFHFSTLENGLQVLVVEDQSVPLVTIEIAVHNGAYTEAPEYDGLSHLYEHMFFKANKDLPSQEEFLGRVKELGISFNGTTSDERVNYYVTLSNTKMDEGLDFMNSAIRYPLFLQEEMTRENPVVDGEFQRAESSPVFFLMQDMSHHLWKESYSRKNTIGDHDIIMTATPEKMKIIQEKYYYPNNSIIIIAGAVDHAKVNKMVSGYFGDWKRSDFEVFEKYPIPAIEKLTESESFVTVNENAQIPIMMIGMHGPSVKEDPKATFAADVFNTVLGLQSSKFQQNLVQSGLAYQVGVSYQTLSHVGPINMFFVPNPALMDSAIVVFEGEIAKWTDADYITDAQIEAAKNQLAIQDIYSRESTSNFVHSLTFWWASADLDYYVNYLDNLKAVTRADMVDYVEKYIYGQPNVTGILVSPMMKEQMQLESIAPISM